MSGTESIVTCTPAVPPPKGIATAATLKSSPPSHSAWVAKASPRVMRESPAGFQYRLLASSTDATKALPCPSARAPTPMSRKAAAVVPTLETFWAVAVPASSSRAK